VIGADEVYGTVHSLGCDWETLMVVHVDQVSDASRQESMLVLRDVIRVMYEVIKEEGQLDGC
jgi:hypothetical protein